MALRALEVQVQGTAGLLCSNVQYSDPLGDYCKQKQYFTDKKGKAKTDGVHTAVRILDWLFSGYWMEEGTVEVDEANNEVGFEASLALTCPAQTFSVVYATRLLSGSSARTCCGLWLSRTTRS